MDTNKTRKKKIVLTHSEVITRSNSHIGLFEELSFYDKSVFFTDNLKADRLLYYQLAGNRGGHPEQIEFPPSTEIVVLSDKVVKLLEMSVRHYMLDYIEMKLNLNNSLIILIESDFHRIVKQRAERVNDSSSLNLISRIEESINS